MHFGNDLIISRHFPTNWPPRSPDLNSCCLRLWGYLKHVVFSGPIANSAELKTFIAKPIHNISTDTLRCVVGGACYFSATRAPQLANELEVISLIIDFSNKKPLQSCTLNCTVGLTYNYAIAIAFGRQFH
ncbi:hypothetical protein AVEN_16513-1 [Araneus ventricosus]|uniref:Uncharacterized protein n=1 Tax=Araneus ventricosus TaxID=182803 RepID=A0A4Y2TRH1_ARAVE|nr:hypothetical protein AVEN_160078-1 [Araneus ventricosus]GBO03249.1 hypothetical protein AVEN_16513-1 [Araneus ventricosus]